MRCGCGSQVASSPLPLSLPLLHILSSGTASSLYNENVGAPSGAGWTKSPFAIVSEDLFGAPVAFMPLHVASPFLATLLPWPLHIALLASLMRTSALSQPTLSPRLLLMSVLSESKRWPSEFEAESAPSATRERAAALAPASMYRRYGDTLLPIMMERNVVSRARFACNCSTSIKLIVATRTTTPIRQPSRSPPNLKQGPH